MSSIPEPRPAAPASAEPSRRLLTARQAQTVRRLADATVAELRDHDYDSLTVRKVARRAGVAPATAYTYFTSKEHLVTEVFWQRLQALPPPKVDRRRTASTRVAAALGDLARFVTTEPALGAACSAAMLANDPDVKALRDRIGVAMHRRIADALGDDADAEVLATLDLAVSGALLQAGMGHVDYDALPALLARVADVVVGGRR